jgi:hypothetical protein
MWEGGYGQPTRHIWWVRLGLTPPSWTSPQVTESTTRLDIFVQLFCDWGRWQNHFFFSWRYIESYRFKRINHFALKLNSRQIWPTRFSLFFIFYLNFYVHFKNSFSNLILIKNTCALSKFKHLCTLLKSFSRHSSLRRNSFNPASWTHITHRSDKNRS